MSFEPQYFPSTINDREAEIVVETLDILLGVLKAYCEEKIDVDFERDEIIYAHRDNQEWVYEAMGLPMAYDKFSPIELENETIYSEIKSQPKTDQKIFRLILSKYLYRR